MTLPRCRVKICGITRAEDAVLSARLGADAIGLNFYPRSSRAISPQQITELVADIPPFVTVVGLFVDPQSHEVEQVIESGLIGCLQFHGDESLGFCQSFGVPFIKAIRVRDLASARQQLQSFEGDCGVLLDAYVPGAAGGTGETCDWTVAREIADQVTNPIILAGGLTADNVAASIAQVNPYGVDVSSGVESAPGIKDPDRLQRFITAVNAAVSA